MVLAACGGTTDYLGMPPEEAGAELADKSCDQLFECDVVEISCDPPTGTRVPAEQFFGSREACTAQLQPDYILLFQGCDLVDLTEDQIDDMNSCFNQDPGCYSDEEITELVDAVCNDRPYGSEECQRSREAVSLCLGV